MSIPPSLPVAVDRKPYGHKKWKEFKEQILASDGHKCQQCGRGEADGVILQVHHKKYVSNNKPWEYPPADCFTLCKGCHASTHGHIKPSFGWHYVGENDLEDLIGHCEYCGTEIRFEYFIQHPKWEPLIVGTHCCDNLTGTKLASNHTESTKRFRKRQLRFVESPKWRTQDSGTTIVHHGVDVVIAQRGGTFGITMNAKVGRLQFPSMLAAKVAAFSSIENGEALAYLKKCGAEKRTRPRKRVSGLRHSVSRRD